MAPSIRGKAARIMWAYFGAADIADYTVSRTGTTWKVRGTMVSSDPFRLTQQPLTFTASLAKGEWRWPITELKVDGRVMVATLGPPER